MKIGTVVTYTIAQTEARDALVDELIDLDYYSAEDQSTMICDIEIPNKTIKTINEFCKENFVAFEDGDVISIFSAVVVGGKPYIEMKDYYYDSEEDEFLIG